ncbi:hypothetical protein ACHAWU_000148 [Discostella pseudostelligera]|uniref:ATP synthase F0 subunit 8 n=1 Tax=Discostella pseudostelligera TaxID=259834 RepID=A0ABD3ML78_9STRA
MEVSLIYWSLAFIAIAYPVSRYVLAKGKLLSLSSQSSKAADVNVFAREREEGGRSRAAIVNVESNPFPNQTTTPITNESDRKDQTNNVDTDNKGGWKCACETGGIGLFLPPSMLKSMGGAGAALRLGAGGCYHKQM